jgi:hypothetical protein
MEEEFAHVKSVNNSSFIFTDSGSITSAKSNKGYKNFIGNFVGAQGSSRSSDRENQSFWKGLVKKKVEQKALKNKDSNPHLPI